MPSEHQWEKIYQQEGRLWKEPFPRFGDVIQTFHDRGCKQIIDLGCGSGRNVVGFAKAAFQVTGIDISPTGLSLAHNWLDEESSLPIPGRQNSVEARVGLVQADIRDPLPFQDGVFDGLMSTQVIHHALLSEVFGTISEIWRILAPGGLAVVSVAGRIHDDTEYVEIEPGTFLPQTGSEASLPHHIFDEETLRQAFKAFEVEFIERRDEGRVLMVQAQRV